MGFGKGDLCIYSSSGRSFKTIRKWRENIFQVLLKITPSVLNSVEGKKKRYDFLKMMCSTLCYCFHLENIGKQSENLGVKGEK